MAPLIGLAISAATQFIPELIGKAFDSKTAETVASKVIDLAKDQTGLSDPEEALENFNPSPEDIAALRSDVLKLIEMEIGDVQHARVNNKHEKLTENVAYGIMYGNLVLIAALIGVFAWVATSDLDTAFASTLSAMIGGALNQLYQERQQVAGYLFGSSLGSKLKSMIGK